MALSQSIIGKFSKARTVLDIPGVVGLKTHINFDILLIIDEDRPLIIDFD